ncbi:angiopoietin-2-like [Saccostrea cucullata]|uniref:angiopoietin-2-like n=1 Tax=Saccostrea cuccullata TaxID=36930 RepID=UPI002ED51D90
MCSKRTVFTVVFWTLSLHQVSGQWLDDQEATIQQKAEKLATQFLKSEIQQITRNIETKIMQKFDGIQRVMEEKLTSMIEQVQKEKMEKESDIVRNLSKSILEQQDILKMLKTKSPSDVQEQNDRKQTIRDIHGSVKNIQGKVQNVDKIVESLGNLTVEHRKEKSESVKMADLLRNVSRSIQDIKTGQQYVREELVSIQTNLSCKREPSPTVKRDSIDKLMEVVKNLPGKLNIGNEPMNLNISSNIADMGFGLENISSLTRSQEMFQKEILKTVSMLGMQNHTDSIDKLIEKLSTFNTRMEDFHQIREFISNLTLSFENEKLKTEMLVVNFENIKSLLLDLKNGQLSLREDTCSFRVNDSSIASLDYFVSRLENLTRGIEASDIEILSKGIEASDRNNSNSKQHTVMEPMTGEDCSDILKRFPDTQSKNGVYNIPTSQKERKAVYCDMTTDNGGWTVIQRRVNGSTDFYRNWNEYKNGFGKASHEYWIGNEILHNLTSRKSQELRVDMQRFNGDKAYAVFSTFSVGDEASKYKLTVNGYSGNAGDSMTYSSGMKFSTKDQDNDKDSGDCATYWKSAWWFKACFYTNPNGQYTNRETTGWKYIVWYFWKKSNFALKNIRLMIRPKQ